jgi:serine protease Do
MSDMSLRLFAVLLLAAASWAQTAPAAPQAPAVPAPQAATPSTDQDRAQAEAEKARAEARKQAAKAKAEARKARAEARIAMHEAVSGSYLGIVEPRDVTSDRMAALKLKTEHGVEASAIDRDSPAAKAGLKEHDVILSFNGQPIESVEQLRRLLHETPPGRTVTLGISRNGQPMNVNVTLAKRAELFAMGNFNGMAMPKIPPMPPMDFDVPQFVVLQYSTRNGAMVEDLTPQLAEFFGVKDGEGVLVRSVRKGSAADLAGLKAGDVIVKVGNDKISCSSDWRRVLHEQKTGNVTLGVVRDKREQNLTMKMPERQTSSNSWQINMQQLNNEFEKIQPQLEVEIAKSMAAYQPEFEKLEVSMRKFQEQLQKELQSH